MDRSRGRILIVEDEPDLADTLRYFLQKEGGYEVEVAGSGESGLALARRKRFDLVILDLMLPGMDGLEVCRALRSSAETAAVPILMASARVDESDKLVGLEVGADDYVTKPFSLKEVLARVRARLRRPSQEPPAAESAWSGGGLEIDFEGHVVRASGAEVLLTRLEFALLTALVRSRGRVLTRDHLLESIWGYQYSGESRTVDVHVRRLRRKLGPPGAQIETVFGVGYRFRAAGRDDESP